MVIKKIKSIILAIFTLLILLIVIKILIHKNNYSVNNRYAEIKEFAITYNMEFNTITYDLIEFYDDTDYYDKYHEYLNNEIHSYEKSIILKNDYLFNIDFIENEDNHNLLYCKYTLRELENKYKEHDYSIIYVIEHSNIIESKLKRYSDKYEKINEFPSCHL